MAIEEISALPINDIAYEQLCVCSCSQPIQLAHWQGITATCVPGIETGADSWRALLNIRDLNGGMARWRLGQLPRNFECDDRGP
jgi:hypothetical protein